MRLALVLLLVTACGDDVRVPESDAAPADVNERDSSMPVEDTGASMDGAAQDTSTRTDSGAQDSGAQDSGAQDSGAQDSGGDLPDARIDAPATPPGPVQCRETSECSGPSAGCQRLAPGGVCTGCGNDTDCPGAASCFVGSCVADCDDDTDCNAGFRCLGSGRCAIRSCTTNADCGPYECRGGQCARWRCGDATCPSGFACSGDVCVEN